MRKFRDERKYLIQQAVQLKAFKLNSFYNVFNSSRVVRFKLYLIIL